MPDYNLMTWNMNGKTSAWERISQLAGQGVQVALLQEAVAPLAAEFATYPGSPDWAITAHRDVTRRFCSGVAVLDSGLTVRPVLPRPFSEHGRGEFTASHPGQFSVVDLMGADESIALTLVSLYGIWDHDSRYLFSEATLHRAISDLTVLFQDPTRPRIVVAGDLNIYHAWGRSGRDGYWGPRYDTVFDRLAAYGLDLVGPFRDGPLDRCACGRGDECRHAHTYAHQRNPANSPYQLDFVFATNGVQIISCTVVSDETDWTFSDHLPVRITARVP